MVEAIARVSTRNCACKSNHVNLIALVRMGSNQHAPGDHVDSLDSGKRLKGEMAWLCSSYW